MKKQLLTVIISLLIPSLFVATLVSLTPTKVFASDDDGDDYGNDDDGSLVAGQHQDDSSSKD